MIERILPPTTVAVEAFGDIQGARLHPAEKQYVEEAVPSRRSEFATARACARRALLSLGYSPVQIERGRHGNPIWPLGVIGSITHCHGYRAAAAMRSGGGSLGIDAEPAAALPEGILGSIAGRGERRQVAELAAADAGTPWDRVLFSAKESVYKAWFPLTGRPLGFNQVRVRLERRSGAFTAVAATERHSASEAVFHGRWQVQRGLVVTAVLTPPAPLPGAGSRPADGAISEPRHDSEDKPPHPAPAG
jgi:4'-phosphopantetheinyl transferase EntD